MNQSIYINTRILQNKTTGVQRYLLELLKRFDSQSVEEIHPRFPLRGMQGHAWEQIALPFSFERKSLRRKSVLFSPSNSGPLAIGRQVVTIHDVVPLDHPEWLNSNFAKWYRFLLPKLATRAAAVITVSEFSKERIIERTGVAPERVIVTPNCVDARFRPLPEEARIASIHELKLPSVRFILTLGSLEPRKNLHRLLKAWSMINSQIDDDIWLVVAGGAGLSSTFQSVKFPADLSRVHFTGHIPDEVLPSLYGQALAFTYLSVYEGFGLPPLEAMACGTPVLTGSRTSLPEVVGNAGLTVNPMSMDDICASMLQIIKDSALQQKLSALGIARSSQFNWNDTARRTWDILQGV